LCSLSPAIGASRGPPSLTSARPRRVTLGPPSWCGRRRGASLPGAPRYPTWLSATAQPGAVPGAWLKVADCVVFQSPVHPGGGTNVDGVTVATTAAGAAPTVATAAGSARPSATVAAATGMRTVGCMVSLLTHRSGNRRCCDAASNLARTCGGGVPGASRRQMPDRFRPAKFSGHARRWPLLLLHSLIWGYTDLCGYTDDAPSARGLHIRESTGFAATSGPRVPPGPRS
jgi:hypothetical protein